MKLFSKILALLLVLSLLLTGCNVDVPNNAGTQETTESITENNNSGVNNGSSDKNNGSNNGGSDNTNNNSDGKTTEADTSEAPTSEENPTEAPTTEVASGEHPTEAPTTEQPTGEKPTEEPTTEEPTTEEPTTEEPTTEDIESTLDTNPTPDTRISIKSAVAFGLTFASNSFSTDKYYVEGTITEIQSNSSYANITIENRYGESLYLYRTFGNNGLTYSAMEIQPQVGDTILVYGILGQYKGLAEMKNGWIISIDGSGTETPPDELDPNDPYAGVTSAQFYANYTRATSYEDAVWRSKHGFMSGSIEDQYKVPTTSSYQPMQNGLYVRNYSATYSSDGNTYYVYDAYGNIAYEIYRGGGYVTIEEVAAYIIAFKTIPANYISAKKGDPSTSIWGKYLRLNHSSYSNNVTNYPYEPELPNTYKYMEIDIGTTGGSGNTTADYNTGTKITRGASRIVYGTNDKDKDGIIEADEILVFYTYNHYNDFQEYLNYEGGWGQRFGNETGGGVLDSSTNCNPTPYVATVAAYFASAPASAMYRRANIYIIDTRNLYYTSAMCA